MRFRFFSAFSAFSNDASKTVKRVDVQDRRLLRADVFNRSSRLACYNAHKFAVFVLQVLNENRTDLRDDLFGALFERLAGLCDELRVLLYVRFIVRDRLRCVEYIVIREGEG
jgi:hypothetical protein